METLDPSFKAWNVDRKREAAMAQFPKFTVLLAAAVLTMACTPRLRMGGPWAEAIRNRPEGGVLNIAHRGARSLAPENTLAAGHKAFDAGADGWEIDVQLSRDGHAVLMHDDTLTRTTNAREVFPDRRPWYIADFTLEELRRLDAGSWYNRTDPFGQIKAGAVSAEDQQSYASARIPTLEEALRLTRERGGLIDVEIKQMPRRYPDIVEKVVAAIEAEGMVGRAAISCFDHAVVLRAKQLNPGIGAGPIASNRIGDPARYIVEVLGGDAYFPSGDVVGARSLAFEGTSTVEGSHDPADLNVRDLESLGRAGVSVFVWTINDEPLMRTLMQAPVTGIVTDYPQRLAQLQP
jgi:glycerophosphoryl diester phosphodiesterase